MKRRPMNCRTVHDLLPLHVGGDLERGQTGQVDEHLHRCLPCFREFRELAAIRGRLAVLAEEPLPPGALDGFTEEVMTRIALVEAGEDRGPAAPLPGRARLLRLVPRLAAAAAVLLVVSIGARTWLERGGAEPVLEPQRAVEVGTGTIAMWPGQGGFAGDRVFYENQPTFGTATSYTPAAVPVAVPQVSPGSAPSRFFAPAGGMSNVTEQLMRHGGGFVLHPVLVEGDGLEPDPELRPRRREP